MDIGVQGKISGEVTQHAGHRLDVHTVLESDGCEGVAKIVKPDLWDACSLHLHGDAYCKRCAGTA